MDQLAFDHGARNHCGETSGQTPFGKAAYCKNRPNDGRHYSSLEQKNTGVNKKKLTEWKKDSTVSFRFSAGQCRTNPP
jgi:hypothetical protein